MPQDAPHHEGPRKDRLDTFAVVSLSLFAVFLAFNQIVIKAVNHGLQPIFFAGLRSAIAAVCVGLWMAWRGQPPRLSRDMAGLGLAFGAAFAGEFLFLFLAIDLTTVTHSAVILYSMPVWMAIGAHFFLPGERITPLRGLGLTLAFAGVAWAILDRGGADGKASLAGDVCALLAAFCWAAIALMARGTRLRALTPEAQLFWQVAVSAVILLALAPFFGPLVRDLRPIHIVGLFYQGIVVAAAGFMFWFWLLSIYPASGVASFSFVTPVCGVALGWLLLGEHVGPALIGAAVLVALGIILINRPRAPA